MSIKDCFSEAVRGGELTQAEADALLARLDALGGNKDVLAAELSSAPRVSITRDEIVAYLEQNRVRLMEVVRGDVMQDAMRRLRDDYVTDNGDGSFIVSGLDSEDVTIRGEDRLIRYLEPHAQNWVEVDGMADQGRNELGPKWSSYSLDPSNPSYRETVIHLPALDKDFADSVRAGHVDPADAQSDFYAGHFSEPNIIGHMMTSMVKHEGKPVYLIDQIQSDWGQKLRDGGVRDEAKIAKLKADIEALHVAAEERGARFRELDAQRLPAEQHNARAKELSDEVRRDNDRLDLLSAELKTAEAATPGNPLVNTTDQWTTTTLRRAIRQAAEADADYIAIPRGDTVLTYNPGDEHGMGEFYNKIVPKNLRNILTKLDKNSPAPVHVDMLETPSKGMTNRGDRADMSLEREGEWDLGFTLFPLTDTVKQKVTTEGQAMFAFSDDGAYRGQHGAPDSESGSPLHDVTANGIYPDDFYGPNGLRYYGTGDDVLDRQAYDKIRRMKDKPDEMVAVYRAIPFVEGKPKGLTLSSRYINPGDWVSITRQYAVDHGESALNGRYHLVKRMVPAKELFTAGDSFHEWGWSPARSEGQAMFAFAGENARTADKAKLAEAQQMEAQGKDRTAIWNETGWFRGVDQKWRFEIDDSGAKLDLNGALADGWKPDQTWPIDHVLTHKPLQDAYPDMNARGMLYRDFPQGYDDAAAATTKSAGTIALNSRYRDFRNEDRMRSFVLHEGQHLAQREEGFAKGGNDRTFTPDEIAAERARLMAVKDDPTGWGSVGTMTGDMPDRDVGRSLYRRLAGEVEARTVQKRMDMTADQRRARPPWLDYDVPEDQQIVRFSGQDGGQGMFAIRDEQAVTPGLDMSPEARKQRAEAMGFDTSKVWYRGGKTDRAELRAVESEVRFPAIWFTSRPEVASEYAMLRARNANFADIKNANFSPSVIPAFTRGNFKAVEGLFRAPDFARMGQQLEQAKAEGYDGVLFKRVNDRPGATGPSLFKSSDVLALFDGVNARSVNAAFDPANADSPNLMYALRDESDQTPTDPASLASRISEAIQPYLDASRAAETAALMGMVERDEAGNIVALTRDGKRYQIARSADGAITGITETDAPDQPLSLSLERDGDGLIANVSAYGQTYAVGRDNMGQITDLAAAAASALAGQESAVRQTVGRIIADAASGYGVTLSPERAAQLAEEALAIARSAPDDPVGALNALTEMVNRVQAELAPMMFAMRDESGRPKTGAELRAEQLQMDFAEIDADFQAKMAAPGVDLKAKKQAEREAFQRKRAALLNAKALEELVDAATRFRTPNGLSDKAHAVLLMHESDAVYGGPLDVKHLRETIRNDLLRGMDAMLWNFRKGAITGDKRRQFKGLKSDMADVIRAAAGEKVDNPAAATFAKAWIEAAEKARQRFNHAGGDIGKLETWMAPQYHNPDAMLKMGREAWIAAMEKHFNVFDADGKPVAPAEFRRIAREAFVTITSDGANRIDPNQASMGKGALYKQRADHRVFHAKSADDWLAYNRDYGGGDVYAAMVGHLDMMARDIAAMERFGANPDLVRERLKTLVLTEAKMARPAKSIWEDLNEKVVALKAQMKAIPKDEQVLMADIGRILGEIETLRAADRKRVVKQHVAEIEALDRDLFAAMQAWRKTMGTAELDDRAARIFAEISTLMDEMAVQEAYPIFSKNPVERAQRLLGRADEVWRSYRGHTNTPVSSSIAGFMVGLRNWVSASALSFASISSITDFATQIAARHFIGMPVVSYLNSYLKALTPEMRRRALADGYGLDQVQAAFAEQARFVGALNTRQITGYIADRTHALSLLSPMTQAQKVAFSHDWGLLFGALRDTSWSAMPSEVQRMLKRHDFTPVEWDQIRTAVPEMRHGGPVLTRAAIEAVAGLDLADKWMAMALRERGGAVIEATTRGRTLFISDTQPGTVAGEILRSGAMLKSFPTSYTMLVLNRIYQEILAGRGRNWTTMGYGAAIFVIGTLLGSLAMQLKNIGHGRDPEDMTTARFWAAAFMQSGGLGIFGDFVGSSVNRFGGGLAQTLAGPLAGRASTILDLTAGNAIQYGMDEKTNAGRELVKALRQNTPGALVPFYLRLAYERMLLDGLQRAVDPDHYRAFAQQATMLRKRTKQEFYYPPGGTMRAPNFGAAFGQ